MIDFQDCINSYKRIMDYHYDIVLGKRGKTFNYRLVFRKADFHHIAGLHYLKDIPMLRGKTEKVFDLLYDNRQHCEVVQRSDFYESISDRLQIIIDLERIIESDALVFRYFQRRVSPYSTISADILVQLQDSHLFWQFIGDTDTAFCKSAFSHTTDQYTNRQEQLTVLKKTKVNDVTGETSVIYINPSYKE